MNEFDFIAIDFETANQQRNSACAIGISTVTGGTVNTSSFLIRPPELWFHPINISIHGITADMVKDAPTFGDLYPTIRPYLEHPTIWAHNAPFDAGVLRAVAATAGIAHQASFQCTLKLTRRLLPFLPNHRLSTVCQELAIPLNHHDAASDAEACARIVLQLTRQRTPTPFNPRNPI